MWNDLEFGTLVFLKQFPFLDGPPSDKILIILGRKAGKNAAIAALTTSQQPPSITTSGCHHRQSIFFCQKNPRDSFDKNTFVQLYRLGVLTPKIIASASWTERARLLPKKVSLQTARAIVNCAKQSHDVSKSHFELMGEA